MPINTKVPTYGNDDFDFESRFTASEYISEDTETELSLRPKTLSEYVGQEKLKANLEIYIQAATARQEALDHVLLFGPPGLGKTTLSCIIASELGVNLKITSGPAIAKAGDLAALLTTLERNDILFIDEIHRLPKQVEEVLYPAMEDYCLDLMMGKGPSARSIRIPLKPFTLIGATTRAGQLSAPLRDRFGMTFRLELYPPEELARIVTRSSGILETPILPEGALEIAKRSRGTPRIANRFLKRVRDADCHHPQLRRRPRRSGDLGGGHRGSGSDHRRRLRALSHAVGLLEPHPSRQNGHGGGLPPHRSALPRATLRRGRTNDL